MEQMKCVCVKNPGKTVIEQKNIPHRKEGEALLRILYTGICGSDLNTYRGTLAYVDYPRIPGHEFSAEVVEVEDNCRGIKKGMIVTGNPYYNCGECYSCERGFLNCCMKNETLGVQRDGTFQQFFSMPVDRLYDGKGLDSKSLAVVEPFCISYHAVKRGNVQNGESVLVVGAGTIGIAALIAAKKRGAKVYITDISDQRLERAIQLGANGVCNSSKEDFMSFVKKAVGERGFDVCMECVGSPETFTNCIDAAAYRGRVVIVGVGKKTVDFLFSKMQLKELNMFGSRNATKEDFEEIIEMARTGKIDLLKVVTDIYPMERAAEAFCDLAKKQDSMLKVLLQY